MADPSRDALVAVTVTLVRPEYLTVAEIQREIRDLVDLISLLAPPGGQRGAVLERQIQEDFDHPQQNPEQTYGDDEDLRGLDPALITRVIQSRTVQSRMPREREQREPTLAQDVARRRGRTQQQVEVAELRYGSDLVVTLQTSVEILAFVLMVLAYAWTAASNVRANSRENASDRALLDVRDAAARAMLEQLDYLDTAKGREAVERAAQLIERVDSIRTAKPASPDLFPAFPALPTMPGAAHPGLAPPGLPPGAPT